MPRRPGIGARQHGAHRADEVLRAAPNLQLQQRHRHAVHHRSQLESVIQQAAIRRRVRRLDLQISRLRV